MKNHRKYSPLIFSSEIAQYCFCKVAWWQSRTGKKIKTEDMTAGTRFHKEYGSRTMISRMLRWIRTMLIGFLIYVIIGAVMWLWSNI